MKATRPLSSQGDPDALSTNPGPTRSPLERRGTGISLQFFAVACLLALLTFRVTATPVQSDDFHATSLNTTLWTWVDPLDDSNYSLDGTHLQLSVPAGVTHAVSTSGNTAARIMQAVDDTSMELEAKFSSPVTSQYQVQGIVIEQDNGRYLRIEFHSNGSQTYIYAASYSYGSGSTKLFGSIAAGAPAPLFLRVLRNGNNWTISHSFDGANWTVSGTFNSVINVSQVGPFAANEGSSPPAHTARVDYFFNTSSPIVPEDGDQLVLELETNGQGTAQAQPQGPYASGASVELAATAAANWVFDSWSGDLAETANPFDFNITSDLEVTANFTQEIDNVVVMPGVRSARVVWETLHPTTASLSYGPTTAYENGSVEVTTMSTVHGVDLEDLDPGSTYHFQIATLNANGNPSLGADQTFQTLPSSGIVSDNFNQPTLNEQIWTQYNPVGDGSIQTLGTELSLHVPPGVQHPVLPGGNQSVRLMQSANNEDFEFDVKFNSAVATAYQIQGVIVEQDSGNYLRLEFHNDGSQSKIYAAEMNGSSGITKFYTTIQDGAPQYMRIQRSGSSFTILYSLDGESWQLGGTFTKTLTVQAVGVFAANESPGAPSQTPAHTALVDYFINTEEPPIDDDEDAEGLYVTLNGQGSIDVDPDLASYASGASVELTASPNPEWRFAGWSGDASGGSNPLQLLVDNDLHVTANFEYLGINITGVENDADSATISWTTSVPTIGSVSYGETAAYELGVVEEETLGLNHQVVLTGLELGTTYHYRINVFDAEGNSSNSGDLTFVMIYPSDIISDDFSAPELNTSIWTIEDPVGDGTIELNGAQLEVSVPAGTSHDIWTDGVLPPRIMQLANDTNFEIEVKFESALTERYQTQGILIRQGEHNHLRFEFYSDDNAVIAYGAHITSQTATTRISQPIPYNVPMRMWVTRDNDMWMLSYSADGESWEVAGLFEQDFTVTEVGVYAGNVSGPAHTGVIDYFFNTQSPVLNEDNGRRTINTQVNGNGSVQLTPESATYSDGETVTLDALSSPSWRFTNWLIDGTSSPTNPALLTVSQDHIVRADFEEFIGNVQVAVVEDSATIEWTTLEPCATDLNYGTSPAYGQSYSDPTPKTNHSVIISTELAADGTEFHFEISAEDSTSLVISSGDLTFRSFLPTSLVSDDFFAPGLNSSVWQAVDPLGDSTITSDGARIVIQSGNFLDHQVTATGATVPRIMQPCNDGNFDVEVKFESGLYDQYQMQGLLVEGAEGRKLRLEFYHNGINPFVYASTIANGQEQLHLNQQIATLSPYYMRVVRQGSLWQLLYSGDGESWTQAGQFNSPMVVEAIGPYCGNIGVSQQVVIDYFFNREQPIEPEDQGLFSLTVNLDGMGTVEIDPDQITHIPGTTVDLIASTDVPLWSFSHWSGDLDTVTTSAQLLMDGDKNVTAHFLQDTNTYFDIWYGDLQSFGQPGITQYYANVLGNVIDADGLASLRYSLNSGPFVDLTIGPDVRRNHYPGDFNIDIHKDDLQVGLNDVLIQAEDTLGNIAEHLVRIDYVDGNVWPTTYDVDWSSVTQITDAAYVVDGVWELTEEGVHIKRVGYDRLLAIGDLVWDDYEVVLDMTFHHFVEEDFEVLHGRTDPFDWIPAAGVILRWPGHSDIPIYCPQPRCGWHPHGGSIWWNLKPDGIYEANIGGSLTNNSLTEPVLEYEQRYRIRFRGETLSPSITRYSYKIWPAEQPEPSGWDVASNLNTDATEGFAYIWSRKAGSILLVANASNITFGNIHVTPIE